MDILKVIRPIRVSLKPSFLIGLEIKKDKKQYPHIFKYVDCPICGHKTLDNFYVCPYCDWCYDEGFYNENPCSKEEYKNKYFNGEIRKEYLQDKKIMKRTKRESHE